MPWGRLDDTFYDHPKTVEAIRLGGLAAIGLHVMAWSYSNRHGTNGFISDGWVGRRTRLAEALVNARKEPGGEGMWERVEGGYLIHDFLEFNLSAEEVRAAKESQHASRVAGGVARAAKAERYKGRFAPADTPAGDQQEDQQEDQQDTSRPAGVSASHPDPNSISTRTETDLKSVSDRTETDLKSTSSQPQVNLISTNPSENPRKIAYSSSRSTSSPPAPSRARPIPVPIPSPVPKEVAVENPPPTPSQEAVSPQDLVAMWNQHVPRPIPQVRELTAARLTKVRQRLKTHPARDFWEQAIQRIAASTFCRGNGQQAWIANFDWFIRNDEQAVSALEGKYDNRVGETLEARAKRYAEGLR